MTIKVEGMSCSGCANTVQTALNKMDGIVNAAADLKQNTVTIEYDTREPSMDSLRNAVAGAGYKMIG